MEALTLFDDEPEALLTELFHRLTVYKKLRRDEIDGAITDAFAYLAECGYRLDDLDKLDPEVVERFSDDDLTASPEMHVLLALMALPVGTEIVVPAGVRIPDIIMSWIRTAPFVLQLYEDEQAMQRRNKGARASASAMDSAPGSGPESAAAAGGVRRGLRGRNYGPVSPDIPAVLQIYNLFRILLTLTRASPWLTKAVAAGVRVRLLFQCERFLALKLPHQVLSLAHDAIDFLPTEELVPCLLAGITSWLSRRRFAAMLIRVRAACARARPMVPYNDALACIDALPFAEPSPLAVNRLWQRLLDPSTRSSTYLAIAHRVAALAGTVAQTALYELLPSQSLPNIAGRDKKLIWWSLWLTEVVADPMTAPCPEVAGQLFGIITGPHAQAVAQALMIARAKLEVPSSEVAKPPTAEESALMTKAVNAELSRAQFNGNKDAIGSAGGAQSARSARSSFSARSGLSGAGVGTSARSSGTGTGRSSSRGGGGVLSRMKVHFKPTGPISGAATAVIMRHGISAPVEFYELVETIAELVAQEPHQMAYANASAQLSLQRPVDPIVGRALPEGAAALPPDATVAAGPSIKPLLPQWGDFESSVPREEWTESFPGLQGASDQPVIARIPRVTLQHDSNSRRLVETLAEADAAAAEIAVSAVQGTLRLLHRAVVWTPTVGGREQTDASLVIHVGPSLWAWTWGAITGDVFDDTDEPSAQIQSASGSASTEAADHPVVSPGGVASTPSSAEGPAGRSPGLRSGSPGPIQHRLAAAAGHAAAAVSAVAEAAHAEVAHAVNAAGAGTRGAIVATASRGATFATTGPRGREPCYIAFYVDSTPGRPGGLFRFLPFSPAEAAALAPAITAVVGSAPSTEKQLLSAILTKSNALQRTQASHSLLINAATKADTAAAKAAAAAAEAALAAEAAAANTPAARAAAAAAAAVAEARGGEPAGSEMSSEAGSRSSSRSGRVHKRVHAHSTAVRAAAAKAAAKASANRSPWIDHSSDLHALINHLIFGRKTMSLLDLERLFHSCRLSDDVASETLAEIRRLWSFATTEPIRVRLLAVVDRLLDPGVLRDDNGSYDAITNWLASLESGLDPYKAGASTRAVHELLQRARKLKLQLVSPISAAQLTDVVSGARPFFENADRLGWAYAPSFTFCDVQQLDAQERHKKERARTTKRAEAELDAVVNAGKRPHGTESSAGLTV